VLSPLAAPPALALPVPAPPPPEPPARPALVSGSVD